MNNFYIYDSEFEKELESKVNETLDLIKTERAEKRKFYDDEEELLLFDNFTKDLISQVKYLQKQFYKRYTLDDYVQRSPKTKEFIPSPAFSLTLFNSDKLMYNLYVVLLNMNYIAYKSYFVKFAAERAQISKSTVYNKINEMIYLGMIEEFNNCIRLTSQCLTCALQIKNFRHSEVPKDVKAHTKLYLNLRCVGYRSKKSKEIKDKFGYKFTTKKGIIINEHTILYKNRNYIDYNFFITHPKFTTVYVLSRKLAEKPHGNFNAIYLEDAIDYEKY